MDGTERTAETPPPEAQAPNAARIYDYTLGGSHWLPADRAAAELRGEGLTSFVDFASGLPTEDHVHHAVPGARVVYSDLDPTTCRDAQEMVGHLPNVRYLCHDVREARSLLESAEVRDFLGGERRVAFGLNGITVFLSPEEIGRLFRDLYEWAAPGSRLYITYETKLPGATTPQLERFLEMFEQAGSPFHLYSVAECVEMSRPWHLPEDGLVPLQEYLGLPPGHVTEADREGVGLQFYAAILERP